MVSFTRLAKGCYFLALAFAVYLLVSANSSRGQISIGPTAPPSITVTTGFRGTPPLPTINIPFLSFNNGGFGAVGGSGVLGAGGFGGSSSASGSLNIQTLTLNLGSFFPNDGRIVGLPPPTMTAMLNNLFIANNLFLFSPFTSDTTGAPWSLFLVGTPAVGGGGSVVGGVGGVGGGVGGVGGGATGFGGIGGGTGFGSGAGGFGQGGFGGGFSGGITGGFAGKGLGGFDGKKAL